ncbi:MAG: glycine cleavage system aminomethyltransferase GcvT [Planctomycetes bacterium]|nr:glycine cleavage system aminomethyltransferase GcvT [Planctomycetota bacterium]
MKQTALHDVHAALGAKLIEFGGWHMPVQYGAILDEARCVRTSAGLFDLGHMGRVHVRGKDHLRFLDRVCSNFVAKIPVGAIRYSLFCKPDGNPIDDLLVYREADAVYLVVNASNTPVDLAWLREHARGYEVEIDDRSDATGMLAIQGQHSTEVLAPLVSGCDLAQIGYYKFAFGTVCGLPNTRISRTGYTGELGYELYLDNRDVVRVWRSILAAGASAGVRPIGLGARDILRLEAGMPLYGHEIDATHNPIEAGLDFGVSFHEAKGDWIGREALLAVRSAPRRKLVGLSTDGPRVPRQGARVFAGATDVGYVCSGAVSPMLGTNIASAYVALEHGAPLTALDVDFKGKRQPCTVRALPFFSRTRV